MANFRFGRIRFGWLLLLVLAGLVLLGTYAFWWRPRVTAGSVPPAIVYVGEDASGKPQLFRSASKGDRWTAMQITDIPDATLLEFAVAPNGLPIALVVETAEGGGIWLLPEVGDEIRPLLACPQAECLSPVWSPDGRRLIYERRELDQGEDVAGWPHLWWLDSDTGETLPVLANDYAPAYAARFSPDGQWLSYVAPAEQGIEVYHLTDGRRFLLPSQVGTAAAWSNDGRWMLLSDLELITYHGSDDSDHLTHSHNYQEATQLYVVNVSAGTFDGERTRLSPQAAVDDGLPSWSPDGEWIAFGRKTPRTQSGRQLWLMRPDGSDARALTENDPTIQHGPPHWSPDGRYLLFQRYHFLELGASPGVWILDLNSGEMQQVAANGYLPNWLP